MRTHVSCKIQTTNRETWTRIRYPPALLPLGILVGIAWGCGNGEVATGYYCDAGSFQPSSGAACVAVASCTADEYEAAGPTITTDRVCTPLTICTADEYESAAPTITTDRVCTPLAVCTTDEYESVAPSATTDRVCAPLSGDPEGVPVLHFVRSSGPFSYLEPGEPLDVTVARLPDQTLQLTGRHVVSAPPPWVPTCPDGSTWVVGDGCAAWFVPKILTSSEALELEQLLGGLAPSQCEPFPVPGVIEICDPSILESIEIGETRHSNYCCGVQMNPTFDSAFDAITGFIDRFMPPVK